MRNIMKKLMLLAVAAVFAVIEANADAVYSAVDGVLTINVPEGETNSVATAELNLEENSITQIHKTGLGGLKIDDKTALKEYAGDIYVDQGTWIVASSNALGKLDFDSKGEATHGENVGKVYIADGASIDLASDDRYINNSGKKVIVNGHGVSGNGALTVSVAAANYYKDVLGNNLVLESDSSIWMPKTFNF